MFRLALMLIVTAAALKPQEPTDLQIDQALDRDITALKDLPPATQPRAIADLARRISERPNRNIVTLSTNLAISAGELGPFEKPTLQLVADNLAAALKKAPQDKDDLGYSTLAQMVRYDQVQVSLDDPNFAAAAAALIANEQRAAKADFTLTDLHGRKWHLKALRGKVVLVNFWATWCGPCLRELPELSTLYSRYGPRRLILLSISDEDASALKTLKVPYQVLLDPNGLTRARFGVGGIPRTFVYNRKGILVARTNGPATLKQFSDMLGQAGLH